MLLDNIYLFIKIVDCGSFTKAAEQLDLYQSTMSRRMQQLEETLGIDLFVRSSKKMELTSKGQFYYQELRDLVVQLVEKYKLIQDDESVSGELKMVIPPFIIINFISQEIAEFLKSHPQLKVEVYTSFTDLNNMQHAFDLAITPFFPNISYYTSQKLFSASLGLYATPTYIKEHGVLNHPNDLQYHCVFIPKFGNILFNKWIMKNGEEEFPVEINPFFVYDSTMVAEEMVLNNVGVSLLFTQQAAAKINDGNLLPVLPNYSVRDMSFYLIKPNNIQNSKVSLFIDFLHKRNPDLFCN